MQTIMQDLTRVVHHSQNESNSVIQEGSSLESKRNKNWRRRELILGPMFAGKSDELLRRMRLHAVAGRKCLYMKYSKDKRYNECGESAIVTHYGLSCPALSGKVLEDLLRRAEREFNSTPHYEVLGIDEGQFFPDLFDFCNKLIQSRSVRIIISALDGTFKQEMFPQIGLLLPWVEKLKKLTAVCDYCGEKAYFSFRLTDDETLIVIGGKELYKALCGPCLEKAHVKKMQEAKKENITITQ